MICWRIDIHYQNCLCYLLYQKEGEQWIFKASSYPKLRLDKNWVCQQLQEIGMQVIRNEIINGMICIVAQKV